MAEADHGIFTAKSPDEHVPGLQLSRGYYTEVVRPIIERHYPGLPHSAGLMGHCSDVLGYDTWKSTDHGWGPRVQVFLFEEDHHRISTDLFETMRQELPITYRGFPTNFLEVPGWTRCAHMKLTASPPINHFVEIETVQSLFTRDISWDVKRDPTLLEWLTLTEQALLECTSGEVFHDGLGQVTRVRERLAYWPDDVWMLRMYCLWASIAEEQAFAGRCHDVGDAVGERLILARIVNKLMKLCFCCERRYFPYSKWFGTAFSRLACATSVIPAVEMVLSGDSHDRRIRALCDAYLLVAEMYNSLAITPPVKAEVVDYYSRGYRGMQTEPFAEALRERVVAGPLKDMDLRILSLGVLADDSNFGNSRGELVRLVEAAANEPPTA